MKRTKRSIKRVEGRVSLVKRPWLREKGSHCNLRRHQDIIVVLLDQKWMGYSEYGPGTFLVSWSTGFLHVWALKLSNNWVHTFVTGAMDKQEEQQYWIAAVLRCVWLERLCEWEEVSPGRQQESVMLTMNLINNFFCPGDLGRRLCAWTFPVSKTYPHLSEHRQFIGFKNVEVLWKRLSKPNWGLHPTATLLRKRFNCQ